jgi:hypothetical protein
MPRLLTIPMFLVLASLACAQSPVTLPSKLLLRIEGFDGPSYRVDLEPGSSFVRYRYNAETFTEAAGTREEKLEIAKESWAIFWKRLDEAKVWSWKEHYAPAKDEPDGTVWTVRLDWSNRKVSSSGTNAYPDLKQFGIFKAAVAELLGGRKFE